MGGGRKLRGKEETGKVCFMAVGGDGRPGLQGYLTIIHDDILEHTKYFDKIIEM
jgi:hypothetical protein